LYQLTCFGFVLKNHGDIFREGSDVTATTTSSAAVVDGEDASAYGMIACHECDAVYRLETLPEGATAHCMYCDARLYQHVSSHTLEQSLALHFAALMLFVIANTMPFISLKFAGRVETDMLMSGPMALFNIGMDGIGLVILLTSVLFPLLTMIAALYLLIAARLDVQPPGKGMVYRMVKFLMPWSMLGVFMLAVLIAIVKLLDLAEIEAGISMFAFAVLLPVSVMAQQRFDSSLFWPHQFSDGGESSEINPDSALKGGLWHCHTCALLVNQSQHGSHCPRCGDHLHARKQNSLARTWALLIAAVVMILPANILPIMTVIRFGQGEPSTILAGVVHLIGAGMWPIGLIIFFASIMVPVSKLVALVFLLLSVQRKSTWKPDDRTRLYRVTEMIGSWSMVDIFIIGILTSLVSLDALSTIRPGAAASYFAAVVVLTMLAAQSFDPRLIWDDIDRPGEHDERGGFMMGASTWLMRSINR